MGCAICAEIPESFCANTGRDEYLPEATSRLTRPNTDASAALWECPSCGGLYVWTEYRSQTGSGNNDDETITRIPSDRMAIIRACLQRNEAAVDALFGFPTPERGLVFGYIGERDRDLVRPFFPRMIQDLAGSRDRWVRGTLLDFALEPRDARTILAIMEATPHRGAEHEFAVVMHRCRERAAVSG